MAATLQHTLLWPTDGMHSHSMSGQKNNNNSARGDVGASHAVLYGVCPVVEVVFALQWATFLFFGGCVAVMTVFVAFFFVETKGVPLEECPFIFKKHWFWKR